MQKKESIIIGAGLVGSLLSIYLSKRGYKVKVYERRADMRTEKIAGIESDLAVTGGKVWLQKMHRRFQKEVDS